MVTESLALTAGYRCRACSRPYLTFQSACFLCSTLNSVHDADLTPEEVARASAPRVRANIVSRVRRPLGVDEDGRPIFAEALEHAGQTSFIEPHEMDEREPHDEQEEEAEDPSGDEEEELEDEDYGEAPEAYGLDDVKAEDVQRVPSGITLFDETLGGGLVLSKTHLLAGSPGVGKSSLTLQVLAGLARHDVVLYATAEEEVKDIALRTRRFELDTHHVRKNLKLCHVDTIEEFFAACREHNPVAAVCDSLQKLRSGKIPSGQPGKPRVMSQLAQDALDFAKTMETAFLYIGHARKDGSPAGLNDVMHYMDTLIEFRREGGGQKDVRRLLRVTKSRYCAEQTTQWIMTKTGARSAKEAALMNGTADGASVTLAAAPAAASAPKRLASPRKPVRKTRR